MRTCFLHEAIMNQQAQKAEGMTLPEPVRGFFNLRVRAPGSDEVRKIRLVSKRRSARLYRVQMGDDCVAVKVIQRLKHVDFVRMCWKNIARREFESAQMLMNAGLRVPEPRAWYRNWNLFSWVDSVFVAEFLDGLTNGVDFLKQGAASPALREAFLCRYFVDLRRMLDAGLLHLDAHPGNVLWSGQEREALVWLDNDVLRFPPGCRTRWRDVLVAKHEGKVRRGASPLTLADMAQMRETL